MDENVLRCTVDRGVALIVLNRPAVRNALSAQLRRSLADCPADQDANDEVQAAVLTGADPAFCSGVDRREIGDDASVAAIGPRTAPVLHSAKPLIGAVNGPAYTGGLELALACDFIVASERASFADTHARLGLLPGWGLTVLLTEAVGGRRARQLSVTSLPVDAPTALAWGLVNEVVGHDQLVPRSLELARAAACSDAGAVRRTLRLYDEQARARDAPAWALEAAAWASP